MYKNLLHKISKHEGIRYACDMCEHVPKIFKKHKQSKREGSICFKFFFSIFIPNVIS